MKRGTDLLLKFKLLKMRLGFSAWQAKGILQTLWDFTAENAIEGNIGRFTNQEIAIGIEYDGDADHLISVLTDTRWVDPHPEHRLVIHDWEDHCEDWIKKRLTRKRQTAADNGGQRPPPADMDCANQDHVCLPGPVPGPDPVPVPVPNPVPENPPTPKGGDARSNGSVHYSASFERFWEAYPKRVGKGAAWKVWQRLKCGALEERIRVALHAQCRSVQWLKDGGQFIPNPATWLNQRRWEDDPGPNTPEGVYAGDDLCL